VLGYNGVWTYRTAFDRLPERGTVWTPEHADVFELAVDVVLVRKLDREWTLWRAMTSGLQYKQFTDQSFISSIE